MKGGCELEKTFGTEKEIHSSQNPSELIKETIRQYSTLVFRIAYQNLRNFHDAEDIMQDVGVSIITGNPPLDEPEHLKCWIITVTLNKCKNMKKASWRTKNEPIDDYLSLQAPETQEVMEEIWQLPENYRNIIYLYYYEAFTIAEIAQILGKSQNTVGSGLQRARKMLKKILIKGGYKNE